MNSSVTCGLFQQAAKEGLQIWPPNYLSLVSAETGRIELLRAVTPADFGQSHVQDQPLGPHPAPAERISDEYITKQARFYQTYDSILSAFTSKQVNPGNELKRAVSEFRVLFSEITEKPLLVYYQNVGNEFLSWLGTIG